MKIFRFFKKATPQTARPSDFSVFFREASAGQKKKVFIDVARKASEDQRRVIESVRKITSTPV